MTAWHFILGAYAMTIVAMAIEVVALRARHRAALTSAHDSPPSPPQIDPA